MSYLPSHPKAQQHRTDPRAERKSRLLAASMTSGLAAGVCLSVLVVFTHMPPSLDVPKGNAPITMTVRHVPPPPVTQKNDMHRLVSEAPADFIVPVPKPQPEVKPEPQPVVKPPKPVHKPKPQQKPVKKVDAPASPQPVSAEPAPQTGVFGHETGVRDAKPDRSSDIMVALLHAIDARKKYPKQARRLGLEGNVMLRVRIDGNGKVVSCSVNAKGSNILEKAAAELGNALVGVDIPPARGGGPVEITVPVRYALK